MRTLINFKARGQNSHEDDKMKVFCALRHFPELRQSLKETDRLDIAKITAEVDLVNTKRKKTVNDLIVEEQRRNGQKTKDLCATVLVEMDNQYEDLKHFMREHRERYREERRCHLQLLQASQSNVTGRPHTLHSCISRRTSTRSFGTDSALYDDSPELLALANACNKLNKAGIFIDMCAALPPQQRQSCLQQELQTCGLRLVLSLPPYIALPDPGPVEMSSEAIKVNPGVSYKKPSLAAEFQLLLRQRLEVVLCVRLADDEVNAVFEALYGSGASTALR